MIKQILLCTSCVLLIIIGTVIVEDYPIVSVSFCSISFLSLFLSILKSDIPSDSKGFRLIVTGVSYNVIFGALIQDSMFKGLLDVTMPDDIKVFFQMLYLVSAMCFFGSGGSLLASGSIDSNRSKQYLKINEAIKDVKVIKASVESLSQKFNAVRGLIFATVVVLVIQIILVFILWSKI